MANSSKYGVQGFLHPEGVFDDPKGSPFREEIYHVFVITSSFK